MWHLKPKQDRQLPHVQIMICMVVDAMKWRGGAASLLYVPRSKLQTEPCLLIFALPPSAVIGLVFCRVAVRSLAV